MRSRCLLADPTAREAGPFIPLRIEVPHAWEELGGSLLEFGRYCVLDYLIPGGAGYLGGFRERLSPRHPESYGRLEALARGVRRAAPRGGEAAPWIAELRDLRRRLLSLDRSLLDAGPAPGVREREARDREIIRFGLDCAGRFERLAAGRLDPNDPRSLVRAYAKACNAGLVPVVSRARAVKEILAVDDDPDLLDLLRFMLEGAGYRVHTRGNGAEGVEAAKKLQPDLILLNFMMPVMDGLTACRVLKSSPGTRSIPIIFYSACPGADVARLALDAGASRFLQTPFDPKRLLELVGAMLPARSRRV